MLKEGVMEKPVLALPCFSKTFEVHIDAFDYTNGGVLMQEDILLHFKVVSLMTWSADTLCKRRK